MRIMHVLLIIGLCWGIVGCGESGGSSEAGQDEGTIRTPSVEHRDPRELAEAYVHALFENPEAAFAWNEDALQASISLSNFRRGIQMILPSPEAVTEIRFLGLEDGFQESDGVTSSEVSFIVASSDSELPRCKVTVDVVKSADVCRVRRYGVSALAE